MPQRNSSKPAPPSPDPNNRVRVRGVRHKQVTKQHDEDLVKAYWLLAQRLGEDHGEQLKPTARDIARSSALAVEKIVALKRSIDAQKAATYAELKAMQTEVSVGFDRKVDAPPLANFASEGWGRLARFCFAQIGVGRQLDKE